LKLEEYATLHIRGRKPKAPVGAKAILDFQKRNAGLCLARILAMARDKTLKKTNPKLYLDCNEFFYESYAGKATVAKEPLIDTPVQFRFVIVQNKEELGTTVIEGEYKRLDEGQEETADTAGIDGSAVEEEGLLDTAEPSEAD